MKLPWLRPVVALGLAVTGCASLPPIHEETRPPAGPATTPEYVVAKPPPRGAAITGEPLDPAGVSPGVPRLVWVPEWRLYLREGHDAVHHDGMYYLYAHGDWYVGETDRGPWRAVTRTRIHASLPTTTDDRVVQLATRYVGRPYTWGGSSPGGFDCSGFVMYVYAKLGVSLPHNAARQYAYGTQVGRDQLKPGDLVFFDRLRHNGIYIGAGRFVHASKRGSGVKISRLDESWFHERWSGARRLRTNDAP
jgi:cell wall-associated NlpC family hydrolase